MRRVLLGLRVLLAVGGVHQAAATVASVRHVDRCISDSAAVGCTRAGPHASLDGVTTGLLLLTGFGLRNAAPAATLLLALFFAVMLPALIKGMAIDCACFGLGEAISAKTTATWRISRRRSPGWQ